MRLFLPLLMFGLLGTAGASIALADDRPEIAVTFLGDRFEPADVSVPAGVKFLLRVENKSTMAMEWESAALQREKIVVAGKSAQILIGPLRAGSYEFLDDFHRTVRGHLVAR